MPFLCFTLPDQTRAENCILDAARITIGRAPDNLIQIRDRSVSKHHAELVLVQDHYRLHDLRSTNLSWVDGRAVADFQLHEPCRLRFGNVEADYSPDIPSDLAEILDTLPPSHSEIAFLKRDNSDLQNKIAALQRQIDMLGEARLMPSEKTKTTVPIEVHRRLCDERDQLLRVNIALKRDAANFKSNIEALLRDRNALREAIAAARADFAGATA
jgi:hypothetical protein